MTTETAPRNYAWVRHLLPRIVIGALIAAALVAVYAVIIGEFDETCWRLVGTIGLFVFFSLVSWYDADVSARRAPWFGAISVVTSAYLLIAGLGKIWIPVINDPNASIWEPISWFALVVVTRIGLLHIHLVLNTQRRFTGPIMSKVTVATLVLVGLLTVGLSLPLIFTRTEFSETYWRFLGVIAILDALGTILIPLTYSLFGPKPAKVAPTVQASRPVANPLYVPAAQSAAAPQWAPAGPMGGAAAASGMAAVAAPVPAMAASGPASAPATATAASGPASATVASGPASATAASGPASVTAASAASAGSASAAVASAASVRAYEAPLTAAYPTLFPQGGLRLEWPRYINGAPLPAKPDGTPDFTGVIGFSA